MGRDAQFPDEQDFYGKTLEEALAWCLVWLMAPELGVGPLLVSFAVRRRFWACDDCEEPGPSPGADVRVGDPVRTALRAA